MRGPKPRPSAARALRGPSHHAVNKREPKHKALPVECPEELTSPVAQKEWNRLAPDLIACGQVTVADRALLICYCQKWAQWLDLQAAAADLYTQGKRGKRGINPAIGQDLKVCAFLLKIAAELGLTPSSRSRVAVSPTAGQSTWSELLAS